jgi:hypothetical protein
MTCEVILTLFDELNHLAEGRPAGAAQAALRPVRTGRRQQGKAEVTYRDAENSAARTGTTC